MTPDEGESAAPVLALGACATAVSERLAALAPGLLEEYPLAMSAALINGARGARYSELGDYARLARTIEQRVGMPALESYQQLLLLHFMGESAFPAGSLALPPSVRSLLAAEWRRIVAEMQQPVPGFYRLDNDLFLKDLGLVRGVLLPVGAELVEVGSGVPKRVLAMGGPDQLLRGLYFFVARLRGFRPLLQFHMDRRNLRDFTRDGWDRTYQRLAELLELNPDVKGVFGTAWFYDPAMEWVSPHLAYIRRRREESGAWVFKGREHADALAGALSTSRTRRKLYKEGRYRPRAYYPVWARGDLIRWARDRSLGDSSGEEARSATRRLKIAALHALKYAGLFRLARRLTRRGLRILAYHGIALMDEHRFQGQLYMTPETFRARLALLRRLQVPVLPLGEAVERLRRGDLPPCGTVITIDDGWYGTYRHAVPLLEALGWPATLYVASYYAQKGTQVFNVAVRYLFWKTEVRWLDLAALDAGLAGGHDLADPAGREAAIEAVIAHGEEALDAADRQRFLRRVAEALGIDFGSVEERRLFRLMSLGEIQDAATRGIDIQLHTHRHSLFGQQREHVVKEIRDNRAALAEVASHDLAHFCYPSGVYSSRMFPWLESEGVRTATTCERGLNYAGTPRFALRRLLDGEHLTAIEVEAEVCGVLELLRRARDAVTTVGRANGGPGKWRR